MEFQATLSQTVYFGISDHITRSLLQNNPINKNVVGLIFGEIKANHWNGSLTTELIFDNSSKETKVDIAYAINKIELIKKVFPELECIGWYVPLEIFNRNETSIVCMNDSNLKVIDVHNQIISICSENKFGTNFFVALFNEDSKRNDILSIKLFEVSKDLKEIPFEIALNKAEAISIDSAIKDENTKSKDFKNSFKNSSDSLEILKSKLKILSNALKNKEEYEKTENGRKYLFEIKELMNSFPSQIFLSNNNSSQNEIDQNMIQQYLMLFYSFLRNYQSGVSKRNIKSNKRK